MAKIRKPAGWKHHSDHWYVNERRKHGCYYKCAYCGWSVLGIGPRNSEHAKTCEKRKAHLAEVQSNA
jgi:hypothetical protein